MASNKKILSDVAKNLGLNFISKECIAYGFHKNYLFLIKGSGFFDNRQHIFISFCVKCPYSAVDLQTVLSLSFLKGCSLQVGNYRGNIYMPVKGNHKHNVKAILELLNHVTTILGANRFLNCDEQGNDGITEIYQVKGNYMFLTSALADKIQISLGQSEIEDSEKKENYLLGLAGACAGAVIASIVIFFIARLGYVTSFSSALLGVGITWGYKWKSIKFSNISSLICMIISIIFCYVTFRLDLAVSIYEALDLSLGQSFLHCREIMQSGDTLDTYYRNLTLMAGSGIVGTVVMIFYELSARKKRFQMQKLT